MSKRTFVYVDGFNLYYRALAQKPYKWLSLYALADRILPANDIVEIKYYTARVSGNRDPGEPNRQAAYIRALKTTPGLSIYYGKFLPKKITRPLVNPPMYGPRYVEVHSTEEKGSDVNLASHLIRDGFLKRYEVAVVVSKDTDLCEPMRIVNRELGLTVGLICPDESEAPKQLRKVASFVRHITKADLSHSQFPNPVIGLAGEKIHKPAHW
jgi:uncharacterized LabA/DUF88 family protein